MTCRCGEHRAEAERGSLPLIEACCRQRASISCKLWVCTGIHSKLKVTGTQAQHCASLSSQYGPTGNGQGTDN
ncbi:hypothetical protein EYF80_014097 [Liparis tanakae]|uniref:Uncharacterized protein n=1 Tax=Liparis tanakae TaxID=230148 RepID=A0A4Z2IE80_9TELE|nr:hypothetical protein EYF80_014097 [Liparis tanakae]